jgi:hypothetical protein
MLLAVVLQYYFFVFIVRCMFTLRGRVHSLMRDLCSPILLLLLRVTQPIPVTRVIRVTRDVWIVGLCDVGSLGHYCRRPINSAHKRGACFKTSF